MSSDIEGFSKWLNGKLKEFNTDESVFGSYINGILEGDETVDEKREALEGILSEIIENDIEKVIGDILDKWQNCQPSTAPADVKQIEDVDTKLARLMETQHIATVAQRQYTPEELRIREQILSQYSQVEFDDEFEEDDENGTGGASITKDNDDPLMSKNTNALDVALLQKERREQARLESKLKKEKDKEDREKQKQLREEKKEKRKTVKGERRR